MCSEEVKASLCCQGLLETEGGAYGLDNQQGPRSPWYCDLTLALGVCNRREDGQGTPW